MPQVKDDLSQYIAGCPACAISKPRNHKSHGCLQPVPIPETVLEVWCMDFIVGLPESDSFNALLVVMNKFSCYVCLVPG